MLCLLAEYTLTQVCCRIHHLVNLCHCEFPLPGRDILIGDHFVARNRHTSSPFKDFSVPLSVSSLVPCGHLTTDVNCLGHVNDVSTCMCMNFHYVKRGKLLSLSLHSPPTPLHPHMRSPPSISNLFAPFFTCCSRKLLHTKFSLVAILENTCHSSHKTNQQWPYSQKSSQWHDLSVYQISCFYHKMHNSIKYFTYLQECSTTT